MTAKANHYLELLENARCEGNWESVPELVRKTRKHAPSRSCLALAAETECAISNATVVGRRPSIASSTPDLDLPNRLPKLQEALSDDFPEDKFQAQVCVGWLHWVVGDYDLAIARLPSIDDSSTSLDVTSLTSECTHVCALKSAYLRANCLMRHDQTVDALAALRSAAPVLGRLDSGKSIRKQLRYWSELFLTEYCMLTSEVVRQGHASQCDARVLAAYRSWSAFWDVMQAPVTGGLGFRGTVPRRRVWGEYYMVLSHILQNDHPYEPGTSKAVQADTSPRSQLRAELKYVEAAYRTLVLAETSFPRADEQREEVEEFVHQAVRNWSVLCGRGWREDDLGPGGRSSIGRGLLETLYSAATRTYHSTAILRSLFRLHLSLAEFDLAFKAFDSYLDIVKMGKAREGKTGELEPSLDDDGTVLETMAQAIMALCRYGHQKAGEKARRLGAELEDWLSKLPHAKGPENGTSSIAEHAARPEGRAPVAPHTIALAWQAIGHSHAHWSRLTTEAGSRMEIQAKAVRCFRKSLAPEYGRGKDIRTFFSLALLLAERRELAAAIELTRSALMASKDPDRDRTLLNGPYWQERALIPLWHLLALLLSARQDYAMAFRACEGALEQFKDPAILFGQPDGGFRSQHLEVAGASPAAGSHRGLVDSLDDSEKESILEVKMTQLALIELTEGPEMAVNASSELLSMLTRLFGVITPRATTSGQAPAQPPKTSGTFRGFRGSIFGPKTDRGAASSAKGTNAPPAASERSDNVLPSRPATAQSVATVKPAIHVTTENDMHTASFKARRESSGQRQRSESRRRGSLKKRNRSSSRARSDVSGALAHMATVVDGDVFFTPAQEPTQAELFPFPGKPPAARPTSSRAGLASISAPPSRPADYAELASDVVHAAPLLLPIVQLPPERERAQRMTILVRIWLHVAGLYRRAGMLEDSKGAIAEAQKLVQDLETSSLSCDQGAAGGPKLAGWAEKRSVDDLWGDVWTELGRLALAHGQPVLARSDLEQALTYSPDHAAATVSLCEILLDIWGEEILPAPVVPPLDLGEQPDGHGQSGQGDTMPRADDGWSTKKSLFPGPLGLSPRQDITTTTTASTNSSTTQNQSHPKQQTTATSSSAAAAGEDALPAAYKSTRLPLLDRLSARDRAFALLTSLTRLGTGWDDADAWFALARAYEESGQVDKAREVLWWCVELDESRGVRGWMCLGGVAGSGG